MTACGKAIAWAVRASFQRPSAWETADFGNLSAITICSALIERTCHADDPQLAEFLQLMQPRRAGNIWSNEDAHLAQPGSKPAAKSGSGATPQPDNQAPGAASEAGGQTKSGSKAATSAGVAAAKPGKHAVPSNTCTAAAREEDASIGEDSSTVTPAPPPAFVCSAITAHPPACVHGGWMHAWKARDASSASYDTPYLLSSTDDVAEHVKCLCMCSRV